MSDNTYECMFILDANAYARDPRGAATGIQEMIEAAGGELLANRLWNEQKLAYAIRGRHKGAYWLSYFKMAGDQLAQFNRACQLNDIVMRHLVIKIDPRIVEKLIAAAKGENAVDEAVPEVETEKTEQLDDTTSEPTSTEAETADAT